MSLTSENYKHLKVVKNCSLCKTYRKYLFFLAVHKSYCFELTTSTQGQLSLCSGKDFEAFYASSLCLAMYFLLLISSLVCLRLLHEMRQLDKWMKFLLMFYSSLVLDSSYRLWPVVVFRFPFKVGIVNMVFFFRLHSVGVSFVWSSFHYCTI